MEKKFLVLILCISTFTTMHSQSFKAYYDYDANGNRIQASIIWLDVTKSCSIADISEIADTISIPKDGWTEPETDSSLKDINISVYPNPVHELLLVQTDNADAEGSISLFSINGQPLQEATSLKLSNTIDMSSLADGVYILYIKAGTSEKQFTVVKK